MTPKTSLEMFRKAIKRSRPHIELVEHIPEDGVTIDQLLKESEIIVNYQIWTDDIWQEHFHDKNGRFLFATDNHGMITSFNYDNEGNVELVMTEGDGFLYSIKMDYLDGLMVHSFDTAESEWWFDYVYTAERDYKLSYARNNTGYQEWREYNEIGKVSYQKEQEGSHVIIERWFEYDEQGILSKSKDSKGGLEYYPTETGLFEYKVNV